MLIDYQTLLNSLVRDDSNIITTTDIDKAIQLAVVRYSSDFPLSKIADLTANGLVKLLLPSDWLVGFSTIVNIEYPLNVFPPSLIDTEEFYLYQEPIGMTLFFSFIPTETVRIYFAQSNFLFFAKQLKP